MSQLEKYSKICKIDDIDNIKYKLDSIPGLKQQLSNATSENTSNKQMVVELQENIDVLSIEIKNKEQEKRLIYQQLIALKEIHEQLNSRAIALEKILQSKDRLHQDLLENYKLLQDELNRLTNPQRKPQKSVASEINNLKQALATKLQQSSHKP